jgi:outer membrane receptor protein involved in Fe transport
VLGRDGDPVSGAFVTVAGTTSSAITDGEGRFELEAPVGAHTLEIEATGFATAKTKIAVAADMAPVEVRLAAGGLPGEEIVVAGTPAEGVLSTYVNFGRATIRGADLGVDVRPIPQLTLSGSVSLIKLVDFENDNELQKDLLLNAPTVKLRGSVQVDDLPVPHAFGRVDARYHNRFGFESWSPISRSATSWRSRT